jgi:G3E family GTPase
MGADHGARWKAGEARDSRIVFIGRDLPREAIVQGLDRCLA